MKRRDLMMGVFGCWLAAGDAWAQPDEHHRGERGGGAGPGSERGHDQGQHARPAPPTGQEERRRPEQGGRQPSPQRGPATAPQGRPRPSRPQGGSRFRYSESRYPHALAPRGRYHWSGAWRDQPGYSSRRWAYGQALPRGWWGAPFRIVDYFGFGLLAPPIDYVWVRVGPDALLVNVYTGRIVQVVYGIFY